jgi:hypothetical protein
MSVSTDLWRWSVSVYARNEGAGIAACVDAIAAAAKGVSTHLSIMLNGISDNSLAVASAAAQSCGLPADIYLIAFGDKSNAWNQFIYAVRPPAEVYFFVDGYARVDERALSELARRLDEKPEVSAAAAVPSTGASAARLRDIMVSQGGLHGSLFALRRSFVERLVDRDLRLPTGLYWGDGLIGAMVAHDLDACNPWRISLCSVVPAATWRTTPLSIWRRRDLARYWHRMIRQARGRLENRAVKDLVARRGFGALPASARDLVLDWLRAAPVERRPSLMREPLAVLALRQIRRLRPPEPGDLVPQLAARVVPSAVKF